MDEVVRKERLCYEKFKGKNEQAKNLQKEEKGDSSGKRKKPKYLKKFGRNHQRNKFNKTGENQTAQSQTRSKQMNGNNKRDGTVKMREHLKCWGCGEPHLLRDFPHRNIQATQVLREATTVNGVARNIPKISTALEDRQEEHQSTMVEVEGMIADQSISVLIDPGEYLSYISPQMVEKCNLKSEKFQQSWLVELATSTKSKVTHKLPQIVINLNGYQTELNLNILPLGSYDVMVGRDWLEK